MTVVVNPDEFRSGSSLEFCGNFLKLYLVVGVGSDPFAVGGFDKEAGDLEVHDDRHHRRDRADGGEKRLEAHFWEEKLSEIHGSNNQGSTSR
jgi:hypothetical protein